MRSLIVAVCGLCIMGLFSPGLGQSIFTSCEKYKTKIAAMEQELSNLEEDLERQERRLQEIRHKELEIKKELHYKMDQKRALQRKILEEKNRIPRRCKTSKKCDAYESRVERLKERMDPIYEKMRDFKNEIYSRKKESNRLNHKVDRIENSYAQLGCEGLEPGKTSQSIIDKCTNLFSRWDELQSGIDALNDSIEFLNSRYERQIKSAVRHESELADLIEKMRRYCSHSNRLVILEEMEKERHGYRSLKDDLSDMSRKVHRIRSLRFKGPVLKLKKKEKRLLKKGH